MRYIGPNFTYFLKGSLYKKNCVKSLFFFETRPSVDILLISYKDSPEDCEKINVHWSKVTGRWVTQKFAGDFFFRANKSKNVCQ